MVNTIDLANCSSQTLFFAAIGKAVTFVALYALVALLVNQIILLVFGKKYSELNKDKKDLVILGTILWPLAIIVMIVWWVAEAIALPFTAARKRDLRRLEGDLIERIEDTCNPAPEPVTKFKVGELITGIRGNPDNYNHLNEGCVCKVVSIDEEGRMKVVLVNHKDFNGHVDVIGKVFKAPARNFLKYTKKKASKSKKVVKRR